MNKPFAGDIASVFLFDSAGRVLFQHRDNKPGLVRADMWVTPGGHCEKGESIQESALREFQEETGYLCANPIFVGSWDDELSDRVYRLYVFWDNYDGTSPLHCFEGQEIRFLSRDEASQFLIPEIILTIWDGSIDRVPNNRERKTI